MISFNPSAATPLLLLMGVVAAVGVHQLFLWLGRRREALHPWVVAWCANTLRVLLSHYLQTVADSPEWAGLGARLAWTSSLLLIVVMIGLSHALAGHPLPRPLLAGVAAAVLMAERHPGPIHLLLTDVIMPRQSGRALVERLRPLRPEMQVLYMSSYTNEAIVRHGVLDPDTLFIQKPFTPAALGHNVRAALDRGPRPV
jgi:CheY-like chemotaxis protein